MAGVPTCLPVFSKKAASCWLASPCTLQFCCGLPEGSGWVLFPFHFFRCVALTRGLPMRTCLLHACRSASLRHVCWSLVAHFLAFLVR